MLQSKNAIAIPPGATIREQLENRGISQKEFAQRMDMTEKHISHLINGKVKLTSSVALRLESVLGLPASFWINLESIYREQEARVLAELDMEEDIEIARKIPYAKLAALGWIPKTTSVEEKVCNLRRYFEVAKLGLLQDLRVPGIAYRTAGESESSNYALAAWAQKARLEARNCSAGAINIEKLKGYLPNIRALTKEEPSVFCPKLHDILADCGIIIVYLPHIGGSFLHGATFVDGSHIVIGLTVRGKYADKFWFSLFHELAHIIGGDIFTAGECTEEQEKWADRFARDFLISPDKYASFVNRHIFNRTSIYSFAQDEGIDVGIVLGRLQKDNYVPYDHFNDMKTKYIIK